MGNLIGGTPFAKFVQRNLAGNLIGAEIGVRNGENALYLLNSLKIDKLFLIDNYLSYKDTGGMISQEKQDAFYRELINNIINRKEKIIPIRETSAKARKFFKKEYFDFVYIDGDHRYEAVKDDLNWYDYVKKGGIIGGHDYHIYEYHKVKPAVDEFAKKKNLEIIILPSNLIREREWAIIKPKN